MSDQQSTEVSATTPVENTKTQTKEETPKQLSENINEAPQKEVIDGEKDSEATKVSSNQSLEQLPQDNTIPADSTPASAIEGGREVSKKILYVGGLHKSVTDDMLKDLFLVAGPIQSVKILNDKNKPGFNYAFIEFESTQPADMALHTLNGRIVNNSEIRINWAYQSSNVNNANSDHPTFNIFVGDLSPEVDDETLSSAFSKFQSLIQAHVMWDMQTSRSRGYGFVSFNSQSDAELALQTMNGEWISGRAIRCNWASHKQMNNNNNHNFRNNNRHYQNSRQFRPFNGNMIQQMPQNNGGQNGQFNPQQGPMPNQQNIPVSSNNPVNGQANIPVMSPQSYDIVLRQTPSWQTTVYLGNIAHFTQQTDLIPLLQNFGFIVDFKFHPERGCAFVKYDSHERAALAIVQLAGFTINGRPLKCGWGKDRPPMGQFQNFGRVPPPSMYGQGRP